MPPEQNFAFDARSKIAFCKNHGIGYKAFEALFFKNYIPDQDQGFAVDASARKENWAGISKTYKYAIMVRHPMERLLSVYRDEFGRKEFAAYYDPSLKSDVKESVSFREFIELVVEGPRQLAEFIQENKLAGQSLGLDT